MRSASSIFQVMCLNLIGQEESDKKILNKPTVKIGNTLDILNDTN